MSSNNEKLILIAEALGELRERVVFVGGCVAQLYVTESAAAGALLYRDKTGGGSFPGW